MTAPWKLMKGHDCDKLCMAWALTYLLLMIATPDSFLRDCKRHVIKSLPLTQELSAELFAQNGIGAFRFSAALIEWSQSEWEGLQKSGYKRTKTHGTYHGQPQTLYTLSQLQRVAMSAPCRQEYSRRPCCSTLTNACGMKMSSKHYASTISTHMDRVALQSIY